MIRKVITKKADLWRDIRREGGVRSHFHDCLTPIDSVMRLDFHGKPVVVRHRCGTCHPCRVADVRRWRAAGIKEAELAQRVWFLTFTFAPEYWHRADVVERLYGADPMELGGLAWEYGDKNGLSPAWVGYANATRRGAMEAHAIEVMKRKINNFRHRISASGRRFRLFWIVEFHDGSRAIERGREPGIIKGFPHIHGLFYEPWGSSFLGDEIELMWADLSFLTEKGSGFGRGIKADYDRIRQQARQHGAFPGYINQVKLVRTVLDRPNDRKSDAWDVSPKKAVNYCIGYLFDHADAAEKQPRKHAPQFFGEGADGAWLLHQFAAAKARATKAANEQAKQSQPALTSTGTSTAGSETTGTVGAGRLPFTPVRRRRGTPENPHKYHNLTRCPAGPK